MTIILLNCCPPTAEPQLYAGPAFNLAVRSLLTLGCALANAGLRVTAYGTPHALGGRNAARGLDHPGGQRVALAYEQDPPDFGAIVARVQPHHCILWNGGAEPHVTVALQAAGVKPWFAEAGWFDRENSIFLDPVGVARTSSLDSFVDDGHVPGRVMQLRLDMLTRSLAPQPPPGAGDYLLVLLDGGSAWAYFDPRYKSVSALIDDLARRFPGRRVVVRGHPSNAASCPALPPNMAWGNDGSLFDWTAHCTAVIGASSKATFAAPLFGKPLVLIGRGLTNPDGGGHVFAEAASIAAISDAMLQPPGPRPEVARALLYEALFRRHVYFDDASELALMRNRCLGPVLDQAVCPV